MLHLNTVLKPLKKKYPYGSSPSLRYVVTNTNSTSQRFENAIKLLKNGESESDVSNETKLKLYGLYKAAKEGIPKTDRPSMFNPIDRAKYDAWSSYSKTLTQEEAMSQYSNEVEKILKITISDNESSNETNITTATKSDKSKKLYLKDILFPRRLQKGSINDLNLSTVITKYSSTEGIAEVILNRPYRGNAFNLQMWNDFELALNAVDQDSDSRVVIVSGFSNKDTSKAKSFSTGMDLDVFAELSNTLSKETCEARKRDALGHFIQYLQDVVSLPEKICIPTIAKVNGYCIGGALDLIASFDMRYCTKDSSFQIKEIDLAMVADIGGLQRLPHIIGHQNCRELAYTGRIFNGSEAEKLGLVLKAFDTEEELNYHVHEVAAAIAKKSPVTIR